MKIGIHQHHSVSALGQSHSQVWNSYKDGTTKIEYDPSLDANVSRVGDFSPQWQHKAIDKIDRVGQLAVHTAKQLSADNLSHVLVSFGSSRGATNLWEFHHKKFITQPNSLSPKASPDTTLGSISSWVAQELQINGSMPIDVSMTCSSGSLAIANGIAWLNAGMAQYALVGGAESPVTPFSIQQLKQMKAYSKRNHEIYPCLAGDVNKTENTLVLGEAAAVFLLSGEQAQINIIGIGTQVEPIRYATDLTAEAVGIQQAMAKALEMAQLNPADIDVVISHTPGTIKGDKAEHIALDHIFGEHKPYTINNKWMIGHTYGASGAMSLDLAVHLLKNKEWIDLPFVNQTKPKTFHRVLINSMGFGGIASSIIIEKL